MTSTVVVTPYGAAPGRACGSCTLCCKVYALAEFEKPPGVWCRECEPGKGCKIHDKAPEQCRKFFCLWMSDAKLPEGWRPDHAKFVLSIFPPNGFVYGQVDPGSPGAWRKEPYFAGLKSPRPLDPRRTPARDHVRRRGGDPGHAGRRHPARQDDLGGPVPHRARLRAEWPDLAGDQGLRRVSVVWRLGAAAGPGIKTAASLVLNPARRAPRRGPDFASPEE